MIIKTLLYRGDIISEIFLYYTILSNKGFTEDFTVCSREEEIYSPLLMDFEVNSTLPFPFIEFPTLLEQNQG